MYYKCCVSGCKSLRQDAILHRFPKTEKRLQKWLQCHHFTHLRRLSANKIANLFVCHKHFEKKFITGHGRLLGNAYPTLFNADQIAIGCVDVPSMSSIDAVSGEHNYSKRRHYDHTYCKNTSESDFDAMSSASTVDHKIEMMNTTDVVCSMETDFDATCSALTAENVTEVTDAIDVSRSMETGFATVVGNSIMDSSPEMANAMDISLTVSTGDHNKLFLGSPQNTTNVLDVTCTAQPGINDHLIMGSSQATVSLMEVSPTSPPNNGGSTSHVGLCTVTPRKPGRKRLMHKLKNLTPMCKVIYKEYTRAKKQSSFHQRAKRALKFNKEQSLDNLMKNMNSYAKKILLMQINMASKNKHGRRFSMEEKLIGLAIMKQSPKCYKYLHKIFILPSKSTLNAMVAKLKVETGVNQQVLSLMKKEVDLWVQEKKNCSIIFDEMSLETELVFDKHKNIISGFVELNERKDDFADHALVFMARGLVHKWQQPLAYYFCKGATSGSELKIIIKEVVIAVAAVGLKPLALVCDQGTNFQAVLKSLKEDMRREQTADTCADDIIKIGENFLNIFYDPPHLIKGLRNNFLNKNMKFGDKICKWQDIIDVYETDCHHAENRLLHKLNDEHVLPDKIKKMKVKNCVRVLSKTMSAALSYTSQFSHYADGRPVSKTLQNTAEAVSFLDDLFDSINGASLKKKHSKGKTLRTAVVDGSKHHIFWREAIKKMDNLKFINNKGREESVPSIRNFKITLKSFMRVWQFFKSNNIKIMRPRYFNSDPIENFFGQVRAYNYRNNDPSCHTFKCTFKSLLITRVLNFHSTEFNCEDDAANPAINVLSLFSNNDSIESHHPPDNQMEGLLEQARRQRLNVHSRAYTAGWVVKKILNKFTCKTCRNDLTSQKTNVHDWVSEREYKGYRNMKKLHYPSENMVRAFGNVWTESNEWLENNGHKKEITKNIKENILKNHSFDFINCKEHRKHVLEFFLEVAIRLAIFNWCNVINKILKGTDVSRLQNRVLPKFQSLALLKFKKKLKNKSYNK